MKKSRRTTSKRRQVAVVTGTRAEYGLLSTIMQAIDDHPKLQLQLVVTGMHLLPKFGRTIDQIRRDGWRIDAAVRMQRGDDGPLDQSAGLARGIAGISKFLAEAKIDIVVVLGDRIEALAGALAAVTTGKLLAHIHGGDRAPGDFDDSLRHAITKLAQLHLAATPGAAERIIRMGEDEKRVHWVGAPGLDRLRKLLRNRQSTVANSTPRHGGSSTSRSRLGNANSLNRQSTINDGQFVASQRSRSALVVQHPCGRPATVEYRVMDNILTAAKKAGLSIACIYPNSDRGHEGIIKAIEEWNRNGDKANLIARGRTSSKVPDAAPAARFRAFRSLDRDAYLRELICADVLIGNSSSGIIEAATAGTPAVNVGTRQLGREVSGDSVIHCAESVKAITAAIRKALRTGPINLDLGAYGDGRSGPRIARILASVPLNDSFHRKLNAY